MKIKGRAAFSAAIVPLLLTGTAGIAHAQETAEVADTEIVITATKRAERLQDVPISVSAIGGDQLSKSRVTNADDLVTKVANLQLTSIVGDKSCAT